MKQYLISYELQCASEEEYTGFYTELRQTLKAQHMAGSLWLVESDHHTEESLFARLEQHMFKHDMLFVYGSVTGTYKHGLTIKAPRLVPYPHRTGTPHPSHSPQKRH